MTDDDLINLLVTYAVDQLRYDDLCPDVGMGMSHKHALDIAKKKVIVEAARWNSLAALQIQFTPTIEITAYQKIAERMK